MPCPARLAAVLTAASLALPGAAAAATYEVGPGQPYGSIGAVPWESLGAGDLVRIHARPAPYAEKWVLCARGTEAAPIRVEGVPDGAGALPVITGEGATTRSLLNFWNEERALLKIGGANSPACTTPAWVVVEKLHLRGARAPNPFTGRNGASAYELNAAAIFVEAGQHVTIRGCELEGSGNGLFVAAASEDVLVEDNFIHGNGNPGRAFEHNSYTAAHRITFQGNRYGPLCAGCAGNALKDRSAGTVIRANWIEGGNRQLDLVDGEDSALIVSDPAYGDTFVYANVLIEGTDDGNSQIVHFGGDGADPGIYRPRLWFWNNTVVSKRSATSNTTLFRLSTAAQRAWVGANVFMVTAPGNRLAVVEGAGPLTLTGNWLPTGWRQTHSGAAVGVADAGDNRTGADPGFADLAGGDFTLAAGSPALDAGVPLPAEVAGHPLDLQYLPHQATVARPDGGLRDLGAFERATGVPPPPDPVQPAKARGGCGSAGGGGALALLGVALARALRGRRRASRP